MDCGVCEIRSSVGFCIECKKLLCEVCGVECAYCGKMLCPEHVQTTHSGKKLCGPCMVKRRAYQERRRQLEDL